MMSRPQNSEFATLAMLALSVDHLWAHKAFQEKLGIDIPLLADFHPKGEVARAYGAYVEDYGNASRSVHHWTRNAKSF